MTTARKAIQGTGCPKCGQPRNAPCVYVASIAWPTGQSRSKQVLEGRARTGKPMTDMVHTERLRIMHRRERKARRPRVYPIPSVDLLLAARATMDWDHQEYERLRDWLLENGAILWT